ncbi:MAG: PfkB family carbohydrate kinase [Actinomycetota bacterium]|nr:PfkB family carbohydrate kinase [Actinomycetota bacterium]
MIVCCGAAIVDMVPDAVPGGCNMNVAITAARLGAPTAFLGRVSTDPDGEMLIRHMADSGIDLSLIERGPERTARAIVQTEPTPSFRFDAEGAADSALSRADLSPIGPGPHIVHGGTNVEYRGSTAVVLADLIERVDGLVSCDPNIRPALIDDRDDWYSWYSRWEQAAALYRCSEEDLAWIWPGRTSGSVAEELLARTTRVMIVTHGASPAEIHTRSWSGTSEPVPPVAIADTVGAGDAFVGSILCDLHHLDIRTPEGLDSVEPADWRRLADRANRIAAITCTRVGADPPRIDELDDEPGLRR